MVVWRQFWFWPKKSVLLLRCRRRSLIGRSVGVSPLSVIRSTTLTHLHARPLAATPHITLLFVVDNKLLSV